MRFLWVVWSIFLIGCAAQPEVEPLPATDVGAVELRMAQQRTGGLNVAIQVFDTVDTPTSTIYVAASQVREVERRYLPYLLKQTLDRSGYWGAVRVLPRRDPSAEINIVATITESSGTARGLQVLVTTATGDVWLDRSYRDVGNSSDSAKDPNYILDPFQDIYSSIANDMALELFKQSADERQSLIDAALMVYGQELSPVVFSRYIEAGDNGYAVSALPARDDPMLANLLRIRDAEYLFADSVDAHYEKLYRTVGPTYAWWRFYNYELLAGNERLAKIDATRGATKGSWYAMERVYKTFREAKMNQDALRELSESFSRETEATRASVSGRVVELSGSLDQQYETWRRLLKAMYDEEMAPIVR